MSLEPPELKAQENHGALQRAEVRARPRFSAPVRASCGTSRTPYTRVPHLRGGVAWFREGREASAAAWDLQLHVLGAATSLHCMMFTDCAAPCRTVAGSLRSHWQSRRSGERSHCALPSPSQPCQTLVSAPLRIKLTPPGSHAAGGLQRTFRLTAR